MGMAKTPKTKHVELEIYASYLGACVDTNAVGTWERSDGIHATTTAQRQRQCCSHTFQILLKFDTCTMTVRVQYSTCQYEPN